MSLTAVIVHFHGGEDFRRCAEPRRAASVNEVVVVDNPLKRPTAASRPRQYARPVEWGSGACDRCAAQRGVQPVTYLLDNVARTQVLCEECKDETVVRTRVRVADATLPPAAAAGCCPSPPGWPWRRERSSSRSPSSAR